MLKWQVYPQLPQLPKVALPISMCGNREESTNGALSISIVNLNKAIFGLGGLGFCKKVQIWMLNSLCRDPTCPSLLDQASLEKRLIKAFPLAQIYSYLHKIVSSSTCCWYELLAGTMIRLLKKDLVVLITHLGQKFKDHPSKCKSRSDNRKIYTDLKN